MVARKRKAVADGGCCAAAGRQQEFVEEACRMKVYRTIGISMGTEVWLSF